MPRKPSHGLRNALSIARATGQAEGTRDALESAERARKSLVRGHSFPTLATPEHPEDTRKAALMRARAEMFDLSDRFNTETEET